MKTDLSVGDWIALVLLPVGAVAACVFDPNNPMNHPAGIPVIFAISLWVIWSSHRDAKRFAQQRAELDEGWRWLREQDEELWRRYCPHQDRRA
jgi:hypothetical protein